MTSVRERTDKLVEYIDEAKTMGIPVLAPAINESLVDFAVVGKQIRFGLAGIKGVGEAGTIGSTPAIVNAVVDALSPLGVTHLDMPLTPSKLWQVIANGMPPTVSPDGSELTAQGS